MDEMDGFLAAVDEFVDDEDRIVTYKWLSKHLAVPVNRSRQILQRYAESRQRQSNGIHITYAIIGRDSKGMCVKVVKDNDLDTARSKLEHVISVSIYSIQKMNLSNSGILYSADYDGDQRDSCENAKLGGITYSGAVKLSKEDIRKQKQAPKGVKEASMALEKQFAKPTKDKNKNLQQKMNFFGKAKISPPKKNLELKNVPSEKPLQPKKEPDPPAPVKEPKKSGLAAFMSKDKTDPFAGKKTSKRVKEEPKEFDDESKIIGKNSISSSTEKSIEVTGKPLKKETENATNGTKKSPPKSSSSSKRRLEEEDLRIDDFSDDEDNDFVVKKSDIPVKSVTKTQQRTTSKLQKKGKNTSNENPAKKRRRIQEMSSSSEDESDHDDFRDEMDVIPPSPPPQDIKQDTGNPHAGDQNKRMRKVMKTKTYLDEEGFMVTEKYTAFEESSGPEPVCSGNSGEPEPKVVEPELKKTKLPASSTAAQPRNQTKQASIIGFFRKK